MKKIYFLILTVFFTFSFFVPCNTILADEDSASESEIQDNFEGNLYAISACLLDADSGRVLYEKNGYEQRPMASTTKIMTLIVTLEQADLQEIVEVSKKAASQPEVHLSMRTGESYYLKDLCYSLMLESHNDSAYAIAEHVGGSVEGFADLMNQKAKELGCEQTYYITPNGLDAADDTGTHSTTAVDLARVMRYCIMQSPMKDTFLEITGTPSYAFSDVSGARSFSCSNHNAFLNMMEGAISGKTGFTADAGYCYVGALERDGRTFIVALLGCGWPNNKTYKWADTKQLMNYGLDHYFYENVYEEPEKSLELPVENGMSASDYYREEWSVPLVVEGDELQVLKKDSEKIRVVYDLPNLLTAPVEADTKVGSVHYFLEETEIGVYDIKTKTSVEERNLSDYTKYIVDLYFSF